MNRRQEPERERYQIAERREEDSLRFLKNKINATTNEEESAIAPKRRLSNRTFTLTINFGKSEQQVSPENEAYIDTKSTTANRSPTEKEGFNNEKKQKNRRTAVEQKREGISSSSSSRKSSTEKRSKFKTCKITKSPYGSRKDIPYDNWDMPAVRFPQLHSVPEHLLAEFNFMFPSSSNIQSNNNNSKAGKIRLDPNQFLRDGVSSLMKWLVLSFWKEPDYLNFLARIILHKHVITLSNLDWLCTNYSKSNDVRYRLNEDDLVMFSIHESYNVRLEMHSSAHFAVFARGKKLLVEWETEDLELFEQLVPPSEKCILESDTSGNDDLETNNNNFTKDGEETIPIDEFEMPNTLSDGTEGVLKSDSPSQILVNESNNTASSRNTRLLTKSRPSSDHIRPDIRWDNKKNVGMRWLDGKRMAYLITSAGQLNFFAWAIDNKVIDYCMQHSSEIEQHCKLVESMPCPENGKRRKLSEAPYTGFRAIQADTLVRYENNIHTMFLL